MKKGTMLHAGWLTKSPPERKTQGAWKIFKSQWRRRYFVLTSKNLSNTLPGSCPAELEYFETEKQVRRKGRINLDNCEKVVIHMESEYYRHVFVIKTTDRGHNRTYYLAADNEMDMERWVDQLRSVLNLQDEGHVPFRLSPRTNNVPQKTSPLDYQRNPSLTQSIDSTMSPLSGVASVFGTPLPNEDYLPIDQCSSGPPILTPRVAPTSVRVYTLTSPTPGSPGSLASSHHSGSADKYYNLPEDDTPTDDDVYNYPKPYNRDSDIYKVPPTRNGSGHYDPTASYEGSRDSNYDYPPPLGATSGDRDSNYDYPPNAVPVSDEDCVRPLWECQSRTSTDLPGDTYDIVPMRSVSQQLHNGANFSNQAPRPPTSLDDVYDIPGRSGIQMAPPKGHRMPPNVHRYINAAPTPVRGQSRSSQGRGSAADEGLYLPMSSGEAGNDVYLPMNQMEKLMGLNNNMGKRSVGTLPPPPPVPYLSGIRSSGEVPLQKAPMTLPRSQEKTSDSSDPGAFTHSALTDSFRGTQRTRSFRRSIPPPSNSDVSLPLKKTGNDESSSDDEDDESIGSSPKQEYINLNNFAGSDLDSPAVSPPPLKPVVQYLDLDLERGSPMVTSSTSTTSSETQSKVEYNEIDMEKTKALFDAKLTLEKERKGSEKSDV